MPWLILRLLGIGKWLREECSSKGVQIGFE